MKLKKLTVAFFAATILLLTVVRKPVADDTSFQNVSVSQHTISLSTRYKTDFVNEAMRKNILLSLSYMSGKTVDIKKSFQFYIVLHPQETFAFHDGLLPEYKEKSVKTGNAHFNYKEGFVSDGYLIGDGVCHLASLIYWAAKDAGLSAVAPTNHNFAEIPEIPKEYGVAVYYYPGRHGTNAKQNLYVTNNKDTDIYMQFEYDGENVGVNVVRLTG